MTAEIIRIDHELDDFLFHCPLTGTPIVGDVEQSFEQLTSPYYLFSVTTDGVVHARSGDLPDPVGPALINVVEHLCEVGRPGPDGLSPFELHTYMPNVIAGLLPDTTVIFDIGRASQHDQSTPRLWVAMDFTMPDETVDETAIDHVADLVPIE